MGPSAILSANDINIGDIYIGEEKKETIVIENNGEIKASFELIPNETPFGKMFSFDIQRGILGKYIIFNYYIIKCFYLLLLIYL